MHIPAEMRDPPVRQRLHPVLAIGEQLQLAPIQIGEQHQPERVRRLPLVHRAQGPIHVHRLSSTENRPSRVRIALANAG